MNAILKRVNVLKPASGWWLVALVCTLLTPDLLRAEPGVVDTTASPFAKVHTVGLDEVRWTNGFWADRFDLCRTQMLPSMERLMDGTNYSQYLRNFEIAAGLAEGRYRGAPFNDGDFYKLIEGACAAYAVTHDEYLERNIEQAIGIIAQAQRADGYIHTPVLVRQRNGDTNAAPFQDRNNFEMYNLGHLMTAACVHYRATGHTNFLAVACKAADFLYRTFHDAPPEVARSSVCPSHYMGIVELYRATGNPRYLELAKIFFALRNGIKDGGDDNQDRIPFPAQTEAEGHAVRANYLYAGAADLFMETGDAGLWRPLDSIWTNVVNQKMYITGGCGALYDGASPDGAKEQKSITRVHQAYGRNYQLPNTTAYSETCANIGNVLWNWRMFLATGEAQFMDVVELALYNSVLSGGGLDGTNFFYTNPLRVTDPLADRTALVADARALCQFILLSAESCPHHCRIRRLRLWQIRRRHLGEPLWWQRARHGVGRWTKSEADPGNRLSVERPGANHHRRVRTGAVCLEAADSRLGRWRVSAYQ